jgi:hypothetical protein
MEFFTVIIARCVTLNITANPVVFNTLHKKEQLSTDIVG